jgi:hypothetical protein
MVNGICAWLTVVALSGGLVAASPLAQRGRDVLPHVPGPYDMKRLGMGSKATAFIILEDAGCAPCVQSVPFYKSLMKLPEMDGKVRRVVVLAKSGVWPVKDMTDAQGFTPHRLNSGPYPRGTIPGITVAPTIVVFDGTGVQRGKWEGKLSAASQKAVIAALMQ